MGGVATRSAKSGGGGKGARSRESQPLEEESKGERGGDPEEGWEEMTVWGVQVWLRGCRKGRGGGWRRIGMAVRRVGPVRGAGLEFVRGTFCDWRLPPS